MSPSSHSFGLTIGIGPAETLQILSSTGAKDLLHLHDKGPGGAEQIATLFDCQWEEPRERQYSMEDTMNDEAVARALQQQLEEEVREE